MNNRGHKIIFNILILAHFGVAIKHGDMLLVRALEIESHFSVSNHPDGADLGWGRVGWGGEERRREKEGKMREKGEGKGEEREKIGAKRRDFWRNDSTFSKQILQKLERIQEIRVGKSKMTR